jgi:DNA-binding MarR family transcriptional regulator
MALGELADVEAMSQHQLAALLGLEKSTVSRLVAGLVERGWVTRSRKSENRRLYRLALTDDGRVVAARFGKELRAQHEQLLGELTPDERRALTVGLAGLVRVLKSHPQAPHGHGWGRSPTVAPRSVPASG